MITINESNKECKFCDLEAMLNKSPVSYNEDYSKLTECDKCILHFSLVMLRRQAEFCRLSMRNRLIFTNMLIGR